MVVVFDVVVFTPGTPCPSTRAHEPLWAQVTVTLQVAGNDVFSAPYLQVKTLKPLSTLKLQLLISLMEEESFVDGQYVATEGETGDKFFIIVLGNVRECLQTNTCACAACFS